MSVNKIFNSGIGYRCVDGLKKAAVLSLLALFIIACASGFHGTTLLETLGKIGVQVVISSVIGLGWLLYVIFGKKRSREDDIIDIKENHKANLSTQKSNYNDCNGEKTQLKLEISQLKKDKDNLQQGKARLEAEPTRLQGEITRLEDTVRDLNAKTTLLNGQLIALTQELAAEKAITVKNSNSLPIYNADSSYHVRRVQ